jgi:hypothetical protein
MSDRYISKEVGSDFCHKILDSAKIEAGYCVSRASVKYVVIFAV